MGLSSCLVGQLLRLGHCRDREGDWGGRGGLSRNPEGQLVLVFGAGDKGWKRLFALRKWLSQRRGTGSPFWAPPQSAIRLARWRLPSAELCWNGLLDWQVKTTTLEGRRVCTAYLGSQARSHWPSESRLESEMELGIGNSDGFKVKFPFPCYARLDLAQSSLRVLCKPESGADAAVPCRCVDGLMG